MNLKLKNPIILGGAFLAAGFINKRSRDDSPKRETGMKNPGMIGYL
jgi:hypothetical protein